MFRPSSDLSERLPLYSQLINDTQRAVDDGLAEGVDPALFERLATAFILRYADPFTGGVANNEVDAYVGSGVVHAL